MTPAERAADEAWTRRMAELEDECDVTAGRIPFLARKFPVPNTVGMTPDERDATLDRWRAEIHAFMREADRAGARPAAPAVPGPSAAPPELPVS